MAKKETYFSKHKALVSSTDEGRPFTLPVQITDAKRKQFEEGRVLLIDKPLHWTSFDVVRKIRNSLRIKKVGHAGTLDPLATGLLIVCTGKLTKKINGYMAQEKEYTGSITLGAVTPTYDLESLPQDHKEYAAITKEMIGSAISGLTGAIQQMPPVYSAIKKDGVALYELARRGVDVELKPRPVTIYEFSITGITLPVLQFRVRCSTGTYIRSLAHDLGAALGCGGYLSALRRTRIGVSAVEDAQSMPEFLEELSAE